MSAKLKIKKGDTVRVIAGNAKGQEGKVLTVMVDVQKALVEGVNTVSRHEKPSSKNPQGGIVKKEAPVHISNLMLVAGGKTTRVGLKMEGDKKVRYAKKTGEVIK